MSGNESGWQTRLESEFQFIDTEYGWMPKSIYDIQHAEDEHLSVALNKGAGLRSLMVAYQAFAVKTFEEARIRGGTINVYNYALNWACLRRLRCAWNVYTDGYYLDASSLIRGPLEITMYLACVLRGHFQFDRLHDFGSDQWDGESELNIDEMIRLTKPHAAALAADVGRLIYGEGSGLTDKERRELKLTLWTCHSHVHRSESSLFQIIPEMAKKKVAPPEAPEWDIERASLFANVAVLAAWSHVRVLRYVGRPNDYSAEWRQLEGVIEEVMSNYIVSWESPAKMGFLALIEKSFTFAQDTALEQLDKSVADSS